MSFKILCGPSEEVLSRFPDNSFDSIVCDPPAWIHFMGRAWDTNKDYHRFLAVMRECFRVLKPGGHALVWAIPRMSHYTAFGLEDAGFEIRDRIHHVFGSGMPHARDASKAIDEHILGPELGKKMRPVVGEYRAGGNAGVSTEEKGGTFGVGVGTADAVVLQRTTGATPAARELDGWHTNLKPGCEDWWVARKPLVGTLAETAMEYGTGALNIDATRVSRDWDERGEAWKASGHTQQPDAKKIAAPPGRGMILHPGGGWPANFVMSHSDACAVFGSCVADCPVGQMDEQASAPVSRYFNKFYKERVCLLCESDIALAAALPSHQQNAQPNIVLGVAHPSGQRRNEDTSGKSPFLAENVTTYFGTSQETTENFARGCAPINATSKIAQFAKYAVNLCNACAMSFAQKLAAICPGLYQDLQHGRDSILDRNARILYPILVQFAEARESTDTAITIAQLRLLLGYVRLAITEDTRASYEKSDPCSRYHSKASRKEREAGCEEASIPVKTGGEATGRVDGSAGVNRPQAGAGRGGGRRNSHPTVKGLELMRWLVRLVTPKGGIVLDPFAGSGSTICAAVLEGFDALGIDQSEEYCAIARARAAYWAVNREETDK